MSKKNIQMEVLGNSGYELIYPVPAGHKTSHISGDDKITPSDIGAYTKDESNTLFSTKQKIVSITLTTSWAGSASPYTQSVTISGTTTNSKVDLQPDASVIAKMAEDGTTALYIVNNNGSLTAYAVGMKPTASITIQATVSEVSA